MILKRSNERYPDDDQPIMDDPDSDIGDGDEMSSEWGDEG